MAAAMVEVRVCLEPRDNASRPRQRGHQAVALSSLPQGLYISPALLIRRRCISWEGYSYITRLPRDPVVYRQISIVSGRLMAPSFSSRGSSPPQTKD